MARLDLAGNESQKDDWIITARRCRTRESSRLNSTRSTEFSRIRLRELEDAGLECRLLRRVAAPDPRLFLAHSRGDAACEKIFCGILRSTARVFRSDENFVNFLVDSSGAADTL